MRVDRAWMAAALERFLGEQVAPEFPVASPAPARGSAPPAQCVAGSVAGFPGGPEQCSHLEQGRTQRFSGPQRWCQAPHFVERWGNLLL